MTASANAIKLAHIAAQAALDKQGENLVAIDLSGHPALTDIFLLVSANNERLVAAIADEIEVKMHEAGLKPAHIEGKANGRWILLDFGDVICHVMHEEDRLYYSIERLWKDCPVIALDVA